MNINPNRISNAWQKLDNPCDYLTFAVSLFFYTVTLGNWDCFPRAQQVSNNDVSLVQIPIEDRTIIQPETIEKAYECIQAMDTNDILTAANCLKEIFSNLPQTQKDEIRRAFGSNTLTSYTDNMGKIKVLRVLSFIDMNHADAGTYIQDAFPLLSKTQCLIIRSTLANFSDNMSKKLE